MPVRCHGALRSELLTSSRLLDASGSRIRLQIYYVSPKYGAASPRIKGSFEVPAHGPVRDAQPVSGLRSLEIAVPWRSSLTASRRRTDRPGQNGFLRAATGLSDRSTVHLDCTGSLLLHYGTRSISPLDCLNGVHVVLAGGGSYPWYGLRLCSPEGDMSALQLALILGDERAFPPA